MMSKENVLTLLNEKLSENNIKLLDQNILSEWEQVEAHFNKRLFEYKSIKIILLGEATVDAKNYLLNTTNDITTSFLEPRHFEKQSKEDLNKFLIDCGIFPFDLYAVPLPTFIYDNIKFKFKDKKKDQLYADHLKEHFKALKDKIGDNKVQLIMRYTKLKKRAEWKIFKEYFKANFNEDFGKNDSKVLDISKNIRANQDKIKQHFSNFLTGHDGH